MRALVRYLIFFGFLIGAVWLGITVKWGERTAYGHLLRFAERATRVTAELIGADLERQARAHERAAPAVATSAARLQQVARLRQADRKVRDVVQPEPPRTPGRTRVDERLSSGQKRALDRLVTARRNAP